jgi:hypothetical protein
MNDKPALPRDEHPKDQDKPVNVDNAADHRPDHGGGPDLTSPPKDPVKAKGPTARGRNQNDGAKLPDQSLIQKQQRSQGMNHSGWEGKN